MYKIQKSYCAEYQSSNVNCWLMKSKINISAEFQYFKQQQKGQLWKKRTYGDTCRSSENIGIGSFNKEYFRYMAFFHTENVV